MKSLKLIPYVFAAFGIVFLAVAIFITIHTFDFVVKSKAAIGNVVDIVRESSTDSDGYSSYTYFPVVEYTTQNNETIQFKSDTGSNPPSYKRGDTVSILYNPADPPGAKVNSPFELWFLPILFVFFGLVFASIGFIFIISQFRRDAMVKKLLTTGQRLQLEIKNVVLNQSTTVNGRNPYQIVCEYNDNGLIRILYSDDIWFDPREYLKDSKITVYLDQNNHKNYYIDLSFLPKMA